MRSEPQMPDTRQYDAGSPGTGKSHLAVALGVEAVKASRSVYFVTLADLVGALAKAEREGALRQKIHFFCRFALLIADDDRPADPSPQPNSSPIPTHHRLRSGRLRQRADKEASTIQGYQRHQG